MTEAERAVIKREKQARYVCYNLYYMMIVVVTLKEIKLFSMHNGFMQILHTDIFKEPGSYIRSFRQDNMHRKCYVTSNMGVGKVLNIQNGVCLKTLIVRQSNKDPEEIKFKMDVFSKIDKALNDKLPQNLGLMKLETLANKVVTHKL